MLQQCLLATCFVDWKHVSSPGWPCLCLGITSTMVDGNHIFVPTEVVLWSLPVRPQVPVWPCQLCCMKQCRPQCRACFLRKNAVNSASEIGRSYIFNYMHFSEYNLHRCCAVTLNAILAARRHTYDLLSVGNSRHSGSHTGSSFLFDY